MSYENTNYVRFIFLCLTACLAEEGHAHYNSVAVTLCGALLDLY